MEARENKMNENDPNSYIQDLSINDLKNNLVKTNEELLKSLKERFTQNLLTSMIFFMFNHFCKNSPNFDTEGESISNKFFSYWFKNMRKQLRKEMLEVNKKLKDEKMNYLSAIANYTLPTTEDYQTIYDTALLYTKEMFEKNTKFN